MEKLGFEPRTFHMQSERSTTELHTFLPSTPLVIYHYLCHNPYEVITHIFHNAGYISDCYFLIAHQTCFKSNGEAGFRTQHLSHEKRTLYHRLHPLLPSTPLVIYYYHCHNPYEVIRNISQCWLHVYIVIF